jgi:hypothetical protein
MGTRVILFGLAALAVPAALTAAGDPARFDFDPVPRWPIAADGSDHELDEACPAIRQECPGLAPFDSIEKDIAFDDLYDKDGMLVGVHLTKSTGCKPLDEHLMLGERHFRLVFRQEGKPDLDDMRMSLAPGVNPDDVRMVKATRTTANVGC